MNKSSNRFRLPLQKMPFLADWRIKRRLKKAMQARREEEGLTTWGHFFAPKYAGATLSFALVVLAVGGYQWLPGYVYESQTIVRGDYLYDWKRSQEKTKLATLSTPAEKAEYYLDLSDRRLAEADTLVNRSGGFFPTAKAAVQKPIPKVKKIQVKPADSLVAGLITESGVYLGQSIEETGKVKDVQVAKDLLQKIDTRLKQQKTELTKINQQSSDPEVEASIPVLIAQSSAHQKLIDRAEELVLKDTFIARIQGQGFGFQPVELEILADEISTENQVLIGLYDEMDALEDQYYAMEEVLENTNDPEVAMMVADEMEVIEEQIEVLDDMAETREDRLEDLADDIDDEYEDYIEIVDHKDFDADNWADSWYGDHWEDFNDYFEYDDFDHEDEDEDEDDLEIFEAVSDLAEQGFDYLEERFEDFDDDEDDENEQAIFRDIEDRDNFDAIEDLSDFEPGEEDLDFEDEIEYEEDWEDDNDWPTTIEPEEEEYWEEEVDEKLNFENEYEEPYPDFEEDLDEYDDWEEEGFEDNFDPEIEDDWDEAIDEGIDVEFEEEF